MATTASHTQGTRAGRGRRAPRAASGEEREQAILQTAERLLQRRSLAEVSVDDLAQGAGISRPAFYFYFPSKDAVVLTLIDRVVEEVARLRQGAVDKLAENPRAAWREGIESYYATFGAHRPVIRAVNELGATNAEARELWSSVMGGWVAQIAGLIEAERERGAAPDGGPARDLATALVQMNERVLHAIFLGEAPTVEETQVIDTLTHIWLSSIYGESSSASSR
ncbi:MAG TPA: TetR/AcrR family transcriptional regulator [Solirubrobacteraceae bacterium]|nr:TetR/AcrR family transcriptional regulator [Solirubrobacteraceae bacterium]